MTNIPSEEDFARADHFARERSRHLDAVCKNVKKQFEPLCPLHNVYILPQRDVDFRCYVFFQENRDIEICKISGIVKSMIDFIHNELDRVGRGKRGELEIAFEFDSNEHVKEAFDGDYFMRLR